MLFANGSAAAYDGIDLRGYDRLVFYAKASRDVVLQGAFGTGDDSDVLGLGNMHLTNWYQRFELDIAGLDLSDINTFLWVYLHKSQNPFDFTNVSVYLDDIRLESDTDTFETSEGSITLGEQFDANGNLVSLDVGYDSDLSYVVPISFGWGLYRAEIPDFSTPLLLDTATVAQVYVQRCADGVWVPVEETPYAPIYVSESVAAGELSYSPLSPTGPFPGTPVNSTYACGGESITVSTPIGPQTLTTNATVNFAYLVQHGAL
jgi:hypothetical protein